MDRLRSSTSSQLKLVIRNLRLQVARALVKYAISCFYLTTAVDSCGPRLIDQPQVWVALVAHRFLTRCAHFTLSQVHSN